MVQLTPPLQCLPARWYRDSYIVARRAPRNIRVPKTRGVRVRARAKVRARVWLRVGVGAKVGEVWFVLRRLLESTYSAGVSHRASSRAAFPSLSAACDTPISSAFNSRRARSPSRPPCCRRRRRRRRRLRPALPPAQHKQTGRIDTPGATIAPHPCARIESNVCVCVCVRERRQKRSTHLCSVLSAFLRAKDPIDKRERSEFPQ